MPRRKGQSRQRQGQRAARIPLPSCQGPKLYPFVNDKANVEFIRLLSDPTRGGDSYVFEVSIGGNPYALKAFKYYDKEEDELALDEFERKFLSHSEGGYTPLDHLDHYFDPFYNECRAYGRLIAENLNGQVAVRCHGYMMLSAEHEDTLDNQFEMNGWNRLAEEYDEPPSKRQPLRAIIKDLVLEDTVWKPRVAVRMLSHLKTMRKHGVYVMDIKPSNYKGGKLVDFSIALTEPHVVFQLKPDFQIESYKNRDLGAFDEMMRDQKVKTTIRAFRVRNKDTIRKLRSSTKSGYRA
ncbi:MAG: hypothetical protein Q9204_004627 [Flavoplaca sp. TL-2023a]